MAADILCFEKRQFLPFPQKAVELEVGGVQKGQAVLGVSGQIGRILFLEFGHFHFETTTSSALRRFSGRGMLRHLAAHQEVRRLIYSFRAHIGHFQDRNGVVLPRTLLGRLKWAGTKKAFAIGITEDAPVEALEQSLAVISRVIIEHQ